MTKKELEQYGSLKKEIESLEKKLDRLYDRQDDIPVVAGKVTASSPDFPYTEYRVGVQMSDPKMADEIRKLIWEREKRLEKCRELLTMIEQFISEIEDSDLRQIFEKRYIDGMKLRDIAIELNMDRSCIGKKINNFLNFPPIPLNHVL